MKNISKIADSILKLYTLNQIKKEFQHYAKEIFENLKKYHPEISDQKDFNRIAYTIVGIIASFAPSNSNHNKNKKYFPKNYDEKLVANIEGENMYDSEWFKMTDSQQFSIVRKGLDL